MNHPSLFGLPVGLLVLLSAVAVERLTELWLSWKHARWAKSLGGLEFGRGHFPFMVAAHVGLFAGVLTEVASGPRHFVPLVGGPALCVQVLVHAGRWWCVRSLGRHWNTRVIVVPGLPLVRRGPYRWFRHPNYLLVAVEGVTLPLVFTAWMTALLFTTANMAILTVRLRIENVALRLAA
ncbi:isoprenylcysteine carboxyl methyltransferase family protein [Streptomyces sp. NPDC060000]|uniref:isoprenylcysteine carboxyl methyltransferase family protein n=1 Tax=Streptomyces sp. NPDC060000 TaxID=3347031 RepID=UPI0036AA31D5